MAPTVTVPAAAIYLLATGVEAVRVGRQEGLANIPVVWSIFPVLHGCHGVGFAAGLLHYLRNPDWHEPERVEPEPSRRRVSLDHPGTEIPHRHVNEVEPVTHLADVG